MKLPKDPLFRLLLINGIAGVAIAILVLGGIFWANIGNLRTLVLTAEDPVLPVLMLAVGLVITLGSVVIGSAIMLLGHNSGEGGTPRKVPVFRLDKELQTVPVAAVGRQRNLR
ncbi:MAG: hypothetical protein AAGA50_20985 [Pseudomonadota bacterium]